MLPNVGAGSFELVERHIRLQFLAALLLKQSAAYLVCTACFCM